MVKFSEVANGVARTGLLFTGLLGLYLSHQKRMPEYMTYVSYYIACIGLGALAQYLIEYEYKESEDKDKDSRTTTQEDMAEPLPTEQKSATASEISREDFEKEADRILLEMKNTQSANVPTKIRLPNLEQVDPDTIQNADLTKLVELGEAKADEITLRTTPVKMKVLDVNTQELHSGNGLAEHFGDVIHQLRLRQIKSEPEF